MQFVKYVRDLGWSQEQLLFLACSGLVLVLAISLMRALKRFLTGRDELRRLTAEVGTLLARVSDLESELDEKSEVDQAVERCLKALEAGWPQHDSEMANAAMGMLLAQAATHPERNKALWQALLAKTDALVSAVVNGSGNDSETTKVVSLRVQEMLTDELSSMSEDPALRVVAERVLRGVLAKTEEALLQSPTAAMTSAMETALKDAMQQWLDDEEDEHINEAATRLFRVVLNLVETRLSADSEKLSKEFDSVLIERVKDLFDSENDEVSQAIAEVARKVVDARGAALLAGDPAQLAAVDTQLVSEVVTWIEENDLGDPLEDLAGTVVKRRANALSAEPPETLVAKVDEQLIGEVETWLSDNSDEVAPSVEGLAKAVVDRQAKALVEAPPEDVLDTVRDKLTDAVGEQLDELTDEISNAARDVAKAAIARSTQAS